MEVCKTQHFGDVNRGFAPPFLNDCEGGEGAGAHEAGGSRNPHRYSLATSLHASIDVANSAARVEGEHEAEKNRSASNSLVYKKGTQGVSTRCLQPPPPGVDESRPQVHHSAEIASPISDHGITKSQHRTTKPARPSHQEWLIDICRLSLYCPQTLQGFELVRCMQLSYVPSTPRNSAGNCHPGDVRIFNIVGWHVLTLPRGAMGLRRAGGHSSCIRIAGQGLEGPTYAEPWPTSTRTTSSPRTLSYPIPPLADPAPQAHIPKAAPSPSPRTWRSLTPTAHCARRLCPSRHPRTPQTWIFHNLRPALGASKLLSPPALDTEPKRETAFGLALVARSGCGVIFVEVLAKGMWYSGRINWGGGGGWGQQQGWKEGYEDSKEMKKIYQEVEKICRKMCLCTPPLSNLAAVPLGGGGADARHGIIHKYILEHAQAIKWI
ncbi:hypothetical protein BD779DRAFT_1472100 [Infundibulicybe gibba]|nr:hypothetical protein BD779DRAFT_1472100 [Infundibulicybe gibba]